MEDLILFEGSPLALGYDKAHRVKIHSPKTAKEALNLQGTELIIASASSEEVTRALFENRNIDIVTNLELSGKEDGMHYRNSGMNQVLCKLADENSIAVCFNLQHAKSPRVLGRMMQNVRLCRKYKVRMLIASFASNLYEMKGASNVLSFAKVLGMTHPEALKAMSFSDLLAEKKVKKPRKGVRILEG